MVRMQQNNKIPSAPSNTTLVGRIFATSKLLQLYDLCNAHDGLTVDSPLFQTLKTSFQDRLANADKDDKSLLKGMRAETVLNNWQLLDDEGKLKSDDILLAKMKEFSALIRDKEINTILADLQKANISLKSLGINDIEKFKSNAKRGNTPNNLKEKLAADYALVQQTDSNNTLIQEISPLVKKQIDSLPYTVYWRIEDSQTNHALRKPFETERKEFLKFMGDFLTLGELLTNKDQLAVNQISPDNNGLIKYYDSIRDKSGNPDLSNGDIAKAAALTYKAAANGCWIHKQKVHAGGNRKTYVETNVNQWIKALKEGRNDLAKLTFISVAEQGKCDKDINWRDEMEKQHITVDHKMDLKYHILFADMKDKQLLNKLWNSQLIIGGSIHRAKTDASENKGNDINKLQLNDGTCLYKIKVAKEPDAAILATYADEKSSATSEVRLNIPEPEKITQLRQNRLSSADNQAEQNIYLAMRPFINGKE